MVFVELQRFHHHSRTKVGTANSNVHYIGEWFSGKSFSLSRNHFIGERFDFVFNSKNFRHYVFSVYQNHLVFRRTQGGVQYRSVFGLVDSITPKILADGFLEFYFLSQIQ